MMVGGLVLEVPFVSFTHFGFITTWTIVWQVQEGSMLLIGSLCLHYGLSKKGQISFKMRLQGSKKLVLSFVNNVGIFLLISLAMIVLSPSASIVECRFLANILQQ
jgi:hypothetical protein